MSIIALAWPIIGGGSRPASNDRPRHIMKYIAAFLALVITLLSVLCLIAIRSGSMDAAKTGDFYVIPLFADATNVERRVQVDKYFGEEFVTFSTTQPAETVLSFYTNELQLSHWQAAGFTSDPATLSFMRDGCPFYQFYISIVAEHPLTAVKMRQAFELCR
jgi:hypothetical protein